MKNLNQKRIQKALEILNLPVFISLKELKSYYRNLAKQNHPDRRGEADKMSDINSAYEVLVTYMENYRFTFSKEEILKQFPQEDYATRFKF